MRAAGVRVRARHEIDLGIGEREARTRRAVLRHHRADHAGDGFVVAVLDRSNLGLVFHALHPIARVERPTAAERLRRPACYVVTMPMLARESRRMTYEEYLALERDSETKHEYVNNEAYAMAGGTPEHARLQGRMIQLLGAALAGRRCEPFSSDLRVRIEATRRSTYPDVTVVCERIEHAADDQDAVTNPTLLVEVLSDSSEAEDRGEKWAHYQRLTSLRHYVLVSQKEARVEVFTRESTGWHYEDIRAGGTVVLSALDATLDVDSLYARALER